MRPKVLGARDPSPHPVLPPEHDLHNEIHSNPQLTANAYLPNISSSSATPLKCSVS